jgi:predicted nucleic acid-binding Zn ribbon protein
MTGIDKIRDDLEGMLKIFQDILNQQENRRRNMILFYFTIIATLLAVVQFYLTFILH